jgi:hypothetical protein
VGVDAQETVMAYVHGPLDEEYGIPVRDVEAIRARVAEVTAGLPPLSPAVVDRVSRILYSNFREHDRQ